MSKDTSHQPNLVAVSIRNKKKGRDEVNAPKRGFQKLSWNYGGCRTAKSVIWTTRPREKSSVGNRVEDVTADEAQRNGSRDPTFVKWRDIDVESIVYMRGTCPGYEPIECQGKEEPSTEQKYRRTMETAWSADMPCDLETACPALFFFTSAREQNILPVTNVTTTLTFVPPPHHQPPPARRYPMPLAPVPRDEHCRRSPQPPQHESGSPSNVAAQTVIQLNEDGIPHLAQYPSLLHCKMSGAVASYLGFFRQCLEASTVDCLQKIMAGEKAVSASEKRQHQTRDKNNGPPFNEWDDVWWERDASTLRVTRRKDSAVDNAWMDSYDMSAMFSTPRNNVEVRICRGISHPCRKE
ncbi:hypothetical protein DFH06DRAFT_1151178 [Mycena polygramma]|nr:hypothetical protein DFH06DRAFT_1151178 [Mycena polygramma]